VRHIGAAEAHDIILDQDVLAPREARDDLAPEDAAGARRVFAV
jgi:hypothetical protein